MNTLEQLSADIANGTGCPIEVVREYLRAFLASPEAKAAVVAEVRKLIAAEVRS